MDWESCIAHRQDTCWGLAWGFPRAERWAPVSRGYLDQSLSLALTLLQWEGELLKGMGVRVAPLLEENPSCPPRSGSGHMWTDT